MASKDSMGFWKNILDYAGGAALLVIFFPLLFILSIIITLRYSCSPVYTQQRIGKKGKPFRIIKLRTIDRQNIPTKDRFAKFLRKTNMDELPQLVNVVLGKMSLVGPRPHLPEHVAMYEQWQRKRLEVKPGITGLRQISQSRKLEFNELLEQDILYITSYRPGLDVTILLKTAKLQLLKIWFALVNRSML